IPFLTDITNFGGWREDVTIFVISFKNINYKLDEKTVNNIVFPRLLSNISVLKDGLVTMFDELNTSGILDLEVSEAIKKFILFIRKNLGSSMTKFMSRKCKEWQSSSEPRKKIYKDALFFLEMG